MSIFLSLEEVYLIYGSIFSCLVDYISKKTDKNTLGCRRCRLKQLSQSEMKIVNVILRLRISLRKIWIQAIDANTHLAAFCSED